MAKANRFTSFAARAALAGSAAATVGVLALTGLPAQAQQTAPARQERGNLIYESIPPRDTQLAEHLGLYRQSRQATFLDWLPDGSMLVTTRFGDVEQVHRIATPLGMREQLTFYPDPVSAARAPRVAATNGQGNAFVFLKDQGGDACDVRRRHRRARVDVEAVAVVPGRSDSCQDVDARSGDVRLEQVPTAGESRTE